MHPTDYIPELEKHCILCGSQPKDVQHDFNPPTCTVACEVCGRYRVTEECSGVSIPARSRPL